MAAASAAAAAAEEATAGADTACGTAEAKAAAAEEAMGTAQMAASSIRAWQCGTCCCIAAVTRSCEWWTAGAARGHSLALVTARSSRPSERDRRGCSPPSGTAASLCPPPPRNSFRTTARTGHTPPAAGNSESQAIQVKNR